METLNRITANEARKILDEAVPSQKLNEIYDAVRAAIKNGRDMITFSLVGVPHNRCELVLKQLEEDGYRLVKAEWGVSTYSIFW